MYKDISKRIIDIKHPVELERDYRWRTDRKDVYRARGESYCPSTMGIRIHYELYEINCNPDFDW